MRIRLIGNQSTETLNKLKCKRINYSMVSNLSRDELRDEYSSSNVFYFASTKEGFGLPILEAQSLGIPVITSNTAAMPYIAKGAAVIVDPYSVESIKESILLFVKREIDIENLKEMRFKNIERFALLNFIESYKNIYNAI